MHLLPLRAAARALRRGCAVLAGASVLVAASGAAPAVAETAPATYVTILGGGDYVGGTTSQLFHPGNATIGISGTSSRLQLSLDGGTHGTDFSLDLVAPQGDVLLPGVYENAQRYPFQASTRPGLSLSGDGRGCNTLTGRFTVYDMAVGANGVIDRFSATYEQHCEGAVAAAVGQISINQPRENALLVAGDRLDWPETYPNTNGRTMPVFVLNNSAEPVALGAALGGADAASFTILSNDCATVAAGASCTVYTRFVPARAGAHAATLTLADPAAGLSYETALTGAGVPGHTSAYFRSDTGDWIGDGGSYDYTPANARFQAKGTPGNVTMSVEAGPKSWTATLDAPDGDVLLPGAAYAGATRYPFNGGGAGLSVTTTGRGCNTVAGSFSIVDIAFDAVGNVQRLAATFEQHCGGDTPALRGWLAWRATEPNTPAGPGGGGDDGGGGGDPGPITPVTNLNAIIDGTTAILGWENPAAAAAVVVRGALGLTPPATLAHGDELFDGPAEQIFVGRLTPGASYAFSVFAKDAGGATAAPATIVLRGSDLAFTATPSTITYGTETVLRAVLRDGPTGAPRAGADVDIYARPLGAREFFLYDRVTTDAYGAVTYGVPLPVSYEFRAAFHGEGTSLGASAGPLLVRVKSRVTAKLSRTSVPLYGTVKVSGSLLPQKPGKRVYLQRSVRGVWKTFASVLLSSASAYSMTFRAGSKGTWKVRVYHPGDTANVASASPTLALSVT